MGAGDVKLWLALLWALPVEYGLNAVPLIFPSFLLTAMLQLLWRSIKKHRPLVEQKAPAAWRTIPFLLMCWYVH
jgi:Flp pilus assembly protein protease CpaA